MEPLFSYQGIELTLIEICLWAAFMLLGILVTLLVAKREVKNPELEKQLSEMSQQQAALQGRLAQFADDSAQRETLFRESLDNRFQTSNRAALLAKNKCRI